jgi:hypothetical protein
MIDADMFVNWVSISLPAGHWGNDTTMMTEDVVAEIKLQIHVKDKLCTDGVYKSLGTWHLKPFRKPKNQNLDEQRVSWSVCALIVLEKY